MQGIRRHSILCQDSRRLVGVAIIGQHIEGMGQQTQVLKVWVGMSSRERGLRNLRMDGSARLKIWTIACQIRRDVWSDRPTST